MSPPQGACRRCLACGECETHPLCHCFWSQGLDPLTGPVDDKPGWERSVYCVVPVPVPDRGQLPLNWLSQAHGLCPACLLLPRDKTQLRPLW